MKIKITLLGILLLTSFYSHSQILDKIKKTKDKIAQNTVDKLSRDPITTSFKDVDKTKYVENTFGDDQEFQSFFTQPFDKDKGFTLDPGFYEGTFQSFCIKAGTYHPASGGGRFYAPIKGPKADIMTTIIDAYQERPDLTQKEVQLLLWAIIAKADFYKMKGPVKATALKLLSPAQIARLSKGALDDLTRSETRKIANASPAIRAVLDAERQLRSKYYSGVRSYKEYEEIAMRAGVEPIVAGFEAGRWTKHPDGFYIRYFPKGYPRTVTQVYIPESMGTTYFNPTLAVAVPAGSGQRLLQTGLPGGSPSSNTGGYVNSNPDPFCEPSFNAAADYAIKQQMIMQNIPGLAVAIYQNGKMVHLKAYGYSDVYSKKPITLGTTMKWASISKSVTGVAAAQLEERGVQGFKVTDDIIDYIENWDSIRYTDTTGRKTGTDRRHPKITIDQLLNNSSGIQQYGKGNRSGDNKFYTLMIRGRDTAVVKFVENKGAYGDYDTSPRKFKAKEAVDVFNKSVLNDEPGMTYHYSSYGFVLAGAAVDKVAPNGYLDWVQTNIIDKAGLQTMQVCEEARPGHAMFNDGMLTSYDSGCQQNTLPAGGFESTICDLAKYAYALSRGEFFENKKDILWNNSVSIPTRPGGSINYSYGLNYMGSGPDLTVWHGGHGGNVRSHMQFFPSDSTGIAILAPAVYADLPELSKHVFQAMSIRPSLYKGKAHSPMDWCRTDMESDEDLFHGVWRKTNKDVLVRTGYEKSGFFDEMERLKSDNYEVVDIETYKNGGKRYWDAVLKKGVPETRLVSDVELSELKNEINSMKADGYIVKDIESYNAGNSGRLWGAVFSKENSYNEAYFKMTRQEFLDKQDEMTARGFALVDMESYPAGNILHWTGVWVAGNRTKLEVNKLPRDLFDEISAQRNQGYRLADIEYYMLSDQSWRVAVVWEKSTEDEFITGEVADLDGDGDDEGNSLTLHNFCDHMSMHHLLSALDYELIDWERIDVEWLED